MKTRWTGSATDRDIQMLGKHCSRKENWTYSWTSKIRSGCKGGYLAQRLVYSMCLVSVCFFNDDLTVHGLRGPEFLPNSIRGPSALAHLSKTHSHMHWCDNLQMINNGYEQVTPRGKFSRREELNGRILLSRDSFGVLCKRPFLSPALTQRHTETQPDTRVMLLKAAHHSSVPSFLLAKSVSQTLQREERVSWVLLTWQKIKDSVWGQT